MIKHFNIPITERIQIFQLWLASINWTLGKNQLTEAELEILSYLLYYNDKYKSIQDYNVRMDLLFSTSIKKKIREEFNIPSQKFETYLNKLRNKGILDKNSINPKFVVYPDNKLQITFSCELKVDEPKKSSEPVVQSFENEEHIKEEYVYNQEPDDLDEEELDESTDNYDFRDPFDKYFENYDNRNIESWM